MHFSPPGQLTFVHELALNKHGCATLPELELATTATGSELNFVATCASGLELKLVAACATVRASRARPSSNSTQLVSTPSPAALALAPAKAPTHRTSHALFSFL